MVVEGTDESFVSNFALCHPWVDAPRVGGANKFLKDPFGGEGGEDLLTLSPSGSRPHWGSLPFELDRM